MIHKSLTTFDGFMFFLGMVVTIYILGGLNGELNDWRSLESKAIMFGIIMLGLYTIKIIWLETQFKVEVKK